jgi:DHA2 family methylenomycin A resistance protein-like MFS transporter
MPNSNAVQAASPRLTLIATSLGFVLIILDVTVVNVALERIEASLGTNVTGLQWVVNAYTLVFASLLLTAGALSDRFGARRMFVNGFALFTAASLACGLAGSITVLIAARIAQGVGAALCVPASLALVSASFPDAVARAAGPVVGGVMVDRFGWPSIFFLNLPLGVVGLWLTLAYAPLGSRTASRGLDVAGQVLAVIALGALTFGFVESGEFGWTHPLILAGFGVFGIASTLFVLTEARSPDPMLQLSLFREPAVGAACLVGLLTNFAYYGLMFVLSLFFQAAKGYSPLVTGLAFLPMTALVTIASLIAGALTARFGPRLPMVLGQALAGTGAGTSYAVIAGPLLAAGVGVALTVPSMTAAVLANVDKRRTGVASGALNAARQTGGVVGVGVFGSLVAGPDRLLGGLHLALILAGAALVIGCLVSILGTGPRRSAKDTVSTVAAPEPSL